MASSKNQRAETPVKDGRRVVTRFLEALQQRQAEKLSAMLTEDAVQVMAFPLEGGVEPSKRHVGRGAVIDFFHAAFKLFATIQLDLTGLFLSDDGTTAFVEAVGDYTLADSGSHYRNRYVFKFVLRDGRVAEFTEFMNPAVLPRLIGQSPD